MFLFAGPKIYVLSSSARLFVFREYVDDITDYSIKVD